MRCIALLFFLLGIISSSFSQKADLEKPVDTTLVRLENELNVTTADTTKARILFELAAHLWSTNSFQSEQYLNESESILIEEVPINNKLLGRVYQYLAALLTDKGRYPEAMTAYIKAKEQFELVNDSVRIANLYHNMAVLYKFQGNLKENYNSLKKAIYINKKFDQEKPLGDNYRSLGNYFSTINAPDSAIFYFEKSKQYFLKVNNEDGLNSIKGQIAAFYLKQKQYKKSIDLFKESLAYVEKRENTVFQIYYLHHLARAYKKSGDYKNALKFNKRALELALQWEYKQWIVNGYLQKSEIYEALGDYKEAYTSSNLHKIYSDSIFNKENVKKIQELKLTYEFRKEKSRDSLLLVKEKELAESQVEILETKNKVQFHWMFLIALSFLGAGAFYYCNNRKNKQEAEIARSKRALAEMKNDMLNKEIEYKKKDLVDFAFNISQNQEWAKVLAEKLEKVKITTGRVRANKLNELENEIKNKIWVDDSSYDFHKRVEMLSRAFYEKLTKQFPNLTKTEIRLCSLIRMSVENKEIAVLQNIDPSSVRKSRYRLRKKLNLEHEEDLDDFLQSF